jgi:hypothetical protein
MEDTAEILIELSVELGINLKKANPKDVSLGKKNGPSLLHIAAYRPNIMEMLLKRCENDARRKDPEIYDLYQATEYPSPFYASERIVKALLKAGFDSEIHELEGGKGGYSAYDSVKGFLETHVNDNGFVKVEYAAIGKLWGYPPSNPPPLRRIPIVPEDGRLYDIVKGKRR